MFILETRANLIMARVSICPKTGLKKGAWTPEEDRLLTSYIARYGHWNWRLLPRDAGLLRDGKSCRLRWLNYLRPNIKRGNFTMEEEQLIVRMHQKFGNRWSAMASSLPGRTDNEIKNHWHTHLKKHTKGNLPSQEKNLGPEASDALKIEEFMPKSIDMVPLSSLTPSDYSWSSFELLNENQIIKDESETSLESVLVFDGDFWNEPFLPQNSALVEQSWESLLFQRTEASSTFDISNYDVNYMSSPTSFFPQEESPSSCDFASPMTIEEFGLFKFEFEENLI